MNRSLGCGALIACALAAFLYAPLHRPLRAATSGRVRLTTLQKQMVLGGQCYDDGGPCTTACYPSDPEFPGDYGGCWIVYTGGDYDNGCDARGCASSGCGTGYIQYSQNWFVVAIDAVGSSGSRTVEGQWDCSRSITCKTGSDDEATCDFGECVPPFGLGPFHCQTCEGLEGGDWSQGSYPYEVACVPAGS